MTPSIQKTPLAKDTEKYARELCEFFPELKDYLLPSVNFRKGQWYTFSPKETSSRTLSDFREGGIFPGDHKPVDHDDSKHGAPVLPKDPSSGAWFKRGPLGTKESLTPHLETTAFPPHWDWIRKERDGSFFQGKIFSHGRVWKTPDTTDYVLCRSIVDILKRDPLNVCVFPEFFPTTHHRYIQEETAQSQPFVTHFFQDTPYHLASVQSSGEEILAMIRESKQACVHLGFVSTMTSQDKYLLHKSFQEVSPHELTVFGRNLQLFIVGAYDLESYAVWEKDI